MKTIVLYKSNTGFTKKYAEWIANDLSCDAFSIENKKSVDLNNYDAVIFGGWVFAGSIQGFKEYREKFSEFKGKKAVFAVGAMPANAPEATKILNDFFTDEEQQSTGTFFMQGGLDYSHMGIIHKMIMKMMCAIMKKQHGIDSEEYKTVSKSFDATDKTAIEPLINYITH